MIQMQYDAQMCWKRIFKLYAIFKNTITRTGLEPWFTMPLTYHLSYLLQKLFALLPKLFDRKGSRRQSFEYFS